MTRHNNVFYSVVFGLILFCESSLQQNTFFRNDYTYLDEIKNFYKIHTIPSTWENAKKQCSREGATLFYPDNEYEAEVVVNLWNNTQPFLYSFIGVSALVVNGVFDTVDGQSLAEVYNKWSPGEPNNAGGHEDCVVMSRLDSSLSDDRCDKKLPFICKKAQSDLTWNAECEMPDTAYKYNKNLDRCYKFHNPASWKDAYALCRSEQSYLAVINSKEEARYFVELTKVSPKAPFHLDYTPGTVLLGFHNRDRTGWKTIKGTSLKDSGYSKWAWFRPNGGIFQLCGSMYYDGNLNDISCSARAAFICEHELAGGNDDLDDRFGDE